MKLSGLIETLRVFPPDMPVRLSSGVGVQALGSWRGSYDELTLCHCENDSEPITVKALLAEAEEALAGKVFTGYKGGEFVMREWTPVWADDWGVCGYRGVAGVSTDGNQLIIETADLSDYR